MLITVVPIGNSRGIRLPKTIIEQLNIEDQLELKVENEQLVLKPITKKPRSGWEEAFQDMNANKDDVLLMPIGSQTEGFDWEW